MLGIYNYLCTILDVHQVVHLCTLLAESGLDLNTIIKSWICFKYS